MSAYFSGLKYKGKEIYTNGFKVLIWKTLLTLDGDILNIDASKVIIDGEKYDFDIAYDMKNTIGVNIETVNEDTKVKNLPCKCKHCKKESLITIVPIRAD